MRGGPGIPVRRVSAGNIRRDALDPGHRLTNGPLADGHQWAAAGLDFRFDVRFLASTAAARSQGCFEEFLNATALHVDAVVN